MKKFIIHDLVEPILPFPQAFNINSIKEYAEFTTVNRYKQSASETFHSRYLNISKSVTEISYMKIYGIDKTIT